MLQATPPAVVSPAFDIVDFANQTLSRACEYQARSTGHPSELPADADEFMARAEAERACSLADDCLRNDLDAARKQLNDAFPNVRCIAVSQSRRLTQYSTDRSEFTTEYTATVMFNDGTGICGAGETLDAAMSDAVSKL